VTALTAATMSTTKTIMKTSTQHQLQDNNEDKHATPTARQSGVQLSETQGRSQLRIGRGRWTRVGGFDKRHDHDTTRQQQKEGV
jgi:hypothetical protein